MFDASCSPLTSWSLVIDRDGRLGRHRGEDHFLVTEPIPDPKVAAANTTNPRLPDGLLSRLVVSRSWELVSIRKTVDRAPDRLATRAASSKRFRRCPNVPSAQSHSPRHDSSSSPMSHRTNASEASGDSNSPRSTLANASAMSSASSGWGFQSCLPFFAASGITVIRLHHPLPSGQIRCRPTRHWRSALQADDHPPSPATTEHHNGVPSHTGPQKPSTSPQSNGPP